MTDFRNTVLCQSCGAPNAPNLEKCEKCGAILPGVLMKRQEQMEKEKLLESLPSAVADKIRDLENQLADRPDAVALHIQLSNLYKDQGLKDFAVEYMEKAAALDPENKFLQQKLRLLIDPQARDPQRIEQIERAQASTKTWSRVVMGASALALVAVVGYFLVGILFPSSYLIAKGGDKEDAISPLFSSDGKRIAYVKAPRFSIFGVVDSMDGSKPSGESWLMVKSLGGDEKPVVKLGDGSVWGVDYAWRPGRNELTYSMYIYDNENWENSGQYVWNVSADGGTPAKLAKGGDFAWSNDGEFLVTVKHFWETEGDEGLYLLHVDSGTETRISALEASDPVWSPDRRELMFRATDPNYIRNLYDQYGTLADDSKIYDRLMSYVGDIYIYNPDTNSTTRITQSGLWQNPLYLPGGAGIGALTKTNMDDEANSLVLMDLDGSNQRILLEPNEDYDWFGKYSFSPDGKQVAFEGYFVNPEAPELPAKETPLGMMGGGKNYVSDIFVINTDGTQLQRLTSKKHRFKSHPVYSPDGSTLAYQVMYIDLRHEIWGMKP